MGDTVAIGGDAAVVRVHGSDKAIALTADCTPRYCFADPIEGGKQAVAETYRNICAVGGEPIAITNCLNFGNPEREDIMGQLVGCLQGMGEACRDLDYPIVSGNVSLYNETDGTAIPPTPSIGGVGLLPDLHRRASASFKRNGDVIAIIGETSGHLGCSLFAKTLFDATDAAPPRVDTAAERKHGAFIRDVLIRKHGVDSVHDLSDGGLGLALADMALSGGTGCVIEPSAVPEGMSEQAFFYGEDQARYVIACKPDHAETLMNAAEEAGIAFDIIGRTCSDHIALAGDIIPLTTLRETSEATISGLFEIKEKDAA